MIKIPNQDVYYTDGYDLYTNRSGKKFLKLNGWQTDYQFRERYIVTARNRFDNRTFIYRDELKNFINPEN